MWQQSLTNLEAENMARNKSFENEESEVKRQANSLHDKINHVEVDMLKELQRHKESCQQKINEQKDKIQSHLVTFEQKRHEYEKILRSQDAVAILEFKPSQGEREENTSPPSFNEPQIPLFKKGECSQNQLCELFGRLALEEEKASPDYEDVERVTVNELKMNLDIPKASTVLAETTKELKRSSGLPRASTFLAETNIVPTSCKNASPLVCMGMGLAWIGTERKKLKLLDKANNISNKKLFNMTFCDLALASKGQLMVLTSDTNVN
ncbi:hypothetical protein FSP39_007362 [Pinctada imbricata]|uniref:Uncharacterized protein n=1 Tax=Pinctada imbricata TaxID=66713 RepID=A0AA88YS84_PINIB|nr:hypothetical protein FSP39_007362 [Pinctada imbricata]